MLIIDGVLSQLCTGRSSRGDAWWRGCCLRAIQPDPVPPGNLGKSYWFTDFITPPGRAFPLKPAFVCDLFKNVSWKMRNSDTASFPRALMRLFSHQLTSGDTCFCRLYRGDRLTGAWPSCFFVHLKFPEVWDVPVVASCRKTRDNDREVNDWGLWMWKSSLIFMYN